MINFAKHITRLEDRLISRGGNDVSTAVTMALRSWQAYRFSDATAESRVLIQRANHTVIAAHRRNVAHAGLYTLTIFIAIEAGNYDSANEMLDKAMGYKSFLRSNDPFYYGVLCFLYAYLELHQKRARSARKHWRALADHIKNQEPSSYYQIMQGLLHLTSGEYTEAYSYLTAAFMAGCNSIFLYEGLYRYYLNASHAPEGMSILPVLIYAANRGADITELAGKYQETLFAAIAASPTMGERLYAVSKYPPILKEICAHRMAKGDTGAEAYAFYREAENKQIFVKGIFNALVRTAYEHKAEKVNHYPMAQFLSAAPEMSPELSVYVFHLLLTSPHLSDLLPDWQSKILQLGAHCLEVGATGREANSIYYYFWSRCKALGITGADVDKAEKILRDNVTFFELSARPGSAVRHVYITEPEKRGMAVYDLPEDIPPDSQESPAEQRGRRAPSIVELVSQSADYTCLGAGQKAILDEKLSIKPMIALAGAELYLHFFQKGDRRFHLLAFLANNFLNMEAPPDEATSVFEALIGVKGITKSYRNRILVSLGRLHYNAFSFDEALECYGQVDDAELGDDFTPQILSVYLQTREYSRAARLIENRFEHIDGETLFNAVGTLLAKSEERESIAGIAYRLLLKGFWGEELLDLVLTHYPACYAEWVTLSKALDENNLVDTRIDVRVLEMALWMANFDAGAQKAFVRLWEARSLSGYSELIINFVELASYEMIAKSTRPEYDVLDILEKWYLEKDSDNTLLSWGLSATYLRYNITTFKSEEILKRALAEMEREGILFPVIKENKPSQIPFIEKHQPFLYKSQPGKDCWLYYRIKGAHSFTAIPMRYMRYGMYAANVPIFYNEEITYYFSEEIPSGSITTREAEYKNSTAFLHNSDDPFFTINNAIIYEQMFKHDKVEEIINRLVKDIQPVRSTLL
ncbi:MAG: DUF5717 family protein [Defluviitaleaceae bacterium]|nr:DUF5717 family protein [Defluviitaleaceae bacterium]